MKAKQQELMPATVVPEAAVLLVKQSTSLYRETKQIEKVLTEGFDNGNGEGMFKHEDGLFKEWVETGSAFALGSVRSGSNGEGGEVVDVNVTC